MASDGLCGSFMCCSKLKQKTSCLTDESATGVEIIEPIILCRYGSCGWKPVATLQSAGQNVFKDAYKDIGLIQTLCSIEILSAGGFKTIQ